MSKQDKNKIVPKLRFPEFREDGGWNIETFQNLFSFKPTNTFTRDNLNYNNGNIKNIHYGDIHTKFSVLFNIKKEIVPYINLDLPIEKYDTDCYCKEGDMIFADASEDLDDVGKSVEIIHLNNEKVLSGLHTILARPKYSKIIIGFGGYLFMSNGIRTQIQRESQGAKVVGISASRLSNIEIFFPQKKFEQQKIASCLSSLDNLINAQSQKLESLKSHKKGLMQQLFPAEGETVPKLRFNEFRESGEWKLFFFDDLVEIIDGDRGDNYPKNDDFYSSGYCVFLNAKNVTKTGFAFNEIQFITQEKDNSLRKGKLKRFDVILTTRGSVGQFAFYSNEVPYDHLRINSGMVLLRVKTEIIKANYLYEFCNSDIISSVIKNSTFGNAQQQLTVTIIKKFPIYVPQLAEQQKITFCLSALGELINAQSRKIELLKLHKKGLMQQLFPSLNGADK